MGKRTTKQEEACDSRMIKKVSWTQFAVVLTCAVSWTSGLVGFGYHEFTTNREAVAAQHEKVEDMAHMNDKAISKLCVTIDHLKNTIDGQSAIQLEILKLLNERLTTEEK